MKKYLTFLFSLTSLIPLSAQIGEIDPDFQTGAGFGSGFMQERVETIAQQPDGKLLIGGWFTEYDGNPAERIVRINLDGSVDNSFDSSEGFAYHELSSRVKTIALQSDGKIVVGGSFITYGDVTRHHIARLNPDGSLDESFNTLTGFNSAVYDLLIQPDGKIVVAGTFSIYNWQGNEFSCRGICRLNTDGSIDEGFDVGSGFVSGLGFGIVNKIVLQPDGKILAAGLFTSFNGIPRTVVARLNADGSLDGSFDAGDNFTNFFGFVGEATALALLPDGKVMLGGEFSHNQAFNSGVVRLNSNGSIDPGFATNGLVSSFIVQSDGKLITSSIDLVHVRRHNTDGSIDADFAGVELNDIVATIHIQFDGNVLLGGWFDNNPSTLMRLVGDTPPVGVNEAVAATSFEVYPNPSDDFFHLTVDGSILNSAPEVVIYTLDGRTIYQDRITQAATLLPCADWPAGIYFVAVTTGGKREVRRVVVG